MKRVLLLNLFFFVPVLFSSSGCALKTKRFHEKKEYRPPTTEKRIKRVSEKKTSKKVIEISLKGKKRKRERNETKVEGKLSPEQELLVKNLITPEEAKPSIWPVVGIVSSKFGWRRGRFHPGIDIAADYGTPIVATAPGKVIYTGYKHGYGYMVVIYHGYGYATVYAHMSGIAVKQGDLVDRGKVIGYVGATGKATGPHLHYEVLKYGIRQNPMIYLP